MNTQPTALEAAALANVRRLAANAADAGNLSLAQSARELEQVLVDSIAQRIALAVQDAVRSAL